MTSPRILVLGGGGMLGHKMFQAAIRRFPESKCTLRRRREDYGLHVIPEFQAEGVIEDVDVTDERNLETLLVQVKPDFVINCVGVIKQRPEANDALPSIRLNSLLPHYLAKVLERWDGKLIHISTDCVFDGVRGDYREDETPNALDIYGRTKGIGEVVTSNAVTLRTSIIGRELTSHHSLLDWFLSQNHGHVKGFTRALWSGVTSNHLADLILSIITDHPALSGLYNVSSGCLSKYGLLVALKEAYNLEVEIEPDDTLALNRTLEGTRLKEAIGYEFPGWDNVLRQLTNDPTKYRPLGE